ncbi:unnamed protein product [Chilo suppressalis]|uniref:Uncharacterized protein n=1 Tax=Chilo suppressalis TaxID=168631 RepID=A0ABN8AWT3_CHISP|nr:unnamed protein product [Chilo suppressalis]
MKKSTFKSANIRVRYPNVYVARPDIDIPEDLDDAMYEDLMQERPELKPYITRRLPYLKADYGSPEGFDSHYLNDHTDLLKPHSLRLPNVKLKDNENKGFLDEMPEYRNQESLYHQYEDYFEDETQMNKPNNTDWQTNHNLSAIVHLNQNVSRRLFWSIFINRYFSGTFKSKCYWCGMNTSDIPRSPLCYDVFESGDGRARTLKRFFRAYCYRNSDGHRAMRKRKWSKYPYEMGASLIREYYGWFTGGCFKRFLDVGKVYTQRGCRAHYPMRSWHTFGATSYSSRRSYAAHRFAKLEYPLKNVKKDMCIVSPHASLTPFSRGISLYARYHVCICRKNYCNRVTRVGLGIVSDIPWLLPQTSRHESNLEFVDW